jgi:hypothetical protein
MLNTTKLISIINGYKRPADVEELTELHITVASHYFGTEANPFTSEIIELEAFIDKYLEDSEATNYRELARRVGDRVLANNLRTNTNQEGDRWELINGKESYCYVHDSEEECEADDYNTCDHNYVDIYQEYVITESGAQYLKDMTDEIVYYNDTLGLSLWCITHWGTSWDYVDVILYRKDNN